MLENRRKGAANGSIGGAAASDTNEGSVTDDSFKNTNLSLMPEDVDNTKLAAALPETKAKVGMQAKNLKIVNKPAGYQSRVQMNIQDGDL